VRNSVETNVLLEDNLETSIIWNVPFQASSLGKIISNLNRKHIKLEAYGIFERNYLAILTDKE
jgi:hypothetical protein